MQTVKFKKLHPDAVMPIKAHPQDAGADLTVYAVENISDDARTKYKYHSGIAVEIPEGHVGLLFPRSSIHKTSNRMTNCVGVIDSNYRGEVCAVMDIMWPFEDIYQVGERFAQLIIMPYPSVEYIEADELSTTDRGEGGYGSTGR